MHPLLGDAARTQIRATIAAIEQRTAAEVVVVVQRQCRVHALPSAALGVGAAVAVQAFLLFAEPEFPLDWFIALPLAAGLLAALLGRLPWPQRRLTPAAWHRRDVQLGGQAAFYRRRVGHTRDRVGVLVHLALVEGQCEVVADTGVLRARPVEDFDRAARDLDLAMARGGDPDAVARALLGLGDVLARCLPRQDDDTNELDDEVTDE